MRLFDVLGPVMIGPSSSHTAGAARIGYTAQKLLGEVPAKADIGLYGSFATTGKGHGTDRALVAGLLGLRPDDPRLPDSFALAEEQGMTFTIHPVELRSAHPNTAMLRLTARSGRELSLKAATIIVGLAARLLNVKHQRHGLYLQLHDLGAMELGDAERRRKNIKAFIYNSHFHCEGRF